MQISERINDQLNYVFYRIEEQLPSATTMKLAGVAGMLALMVCIYFLLDSMSSLHELRLSLAELTAELELLKHK